MEIDKNLSDEHSIDVIERQWSILNVVMCIFGNKVPLPNEIKIELITNTE